MTATALPVVRPTRSPGPRQDREILSRLRKATGQLSGVTGMVEDGRYCIDVLDQVAAATKALKAVALELLDDHLSHCVTDAVTKGGRTAEEKVAEASAAIARLVRS